jgi:hypothetical protein
MFKWPRIVQDERMPAGQAFLVSCARKPSGEVTISAAHLRNIDQAKAT